jgi:hypothetical protein
LNIARKPNVLILPLSKKTHESFLKADDYFKQRIIQFNPDTASCLMNGVLHTSIIDPSTKDFFNLTQKNNLKPMLLFIMTHSNAIKVDYQYVYSISSLPRLPHLKPMQILLP